MIDGLIVTRLTQIKDERGKVMHMMRRDSPVFSEFGEIYFSTAHPGVIKAWHSHSKSTMNYTVVSGEAKFVFFDSRLDSPSQGEIQEIVISPENYVLVSVPHNVWNGFKSIGSHEVIVANLTPFMHEPEDVSRIPFNSPDIQYKW